MNRFILAAAAALALFGPIAARAQSAPTYQAQDGQTRDSVGTFDMVTPSANAGLVPTTALNSVGIVAKAAPGNFYGATMTAGTVAGFLVVANLTAVPASGATLTAAQVLYCVPVAASGIATAGTGIPDRATVGVTVLFSTACGTYTPVGTPAVFIRARAL